jgi:hypothetical protein
MSETPGIMGQMTPLPVPVNEDNLNSLLQLNRMVRVHSLLVIRGGQCLHKPLTGSWLSLNTLFYLEGIVIWHCKNISTYKARTTKLIYHTLWETKIEDQMTPELPQLCLTCCEKWLNVKCWPSAGRVTAMFFQWSDCLQSVCARLVDEAYGSSMQLWHESLEVFAALPVFSQSTRHLVRSPASDCKYWTAGGVPFCFSDWQWIFFPERGTALSEQVQSIDL